ncbi:MAG: radical SAM protein [Deltaproteobacteria bacterium]|nr:radical SAM protein [Deltaproteobacteria bacterium]
MQLTIIPSKVRLDVSTVCQLKCVSCPTAAGIVRKHVGSGFLKPDDLVRFLERNRNVRSIELSNWGEILLNPWLLEILRIAHDHEVELTAGNGVNFNTANEQVLEGLVKYQVRYVSFSIDGASNETYAKYRVSGNFDRVIQNIRKLIQFKEQYSSPYPRLTWQFILFGHNEHELPLAKSMAQELGMHFYPKLSGDDDLSPIKNPDWVRKETGLQALTRKEHARRYGRAYLDTICLQLWNEPQINWDGRLLGCCVNHWGDFGENVFLVGLAQALNGRKIRCARDMLMGKKAPIDGIPCTTCPRYRSMRESKHWIASKDLCQHQAGLTTRAKTSVRRVLGPLRRWGFYYFTN